MGRTGPLRKVSAESAEIIALRGNPGKRPPKQSLRARPAVPNPPSWLSREAKAEWKRITPELDELGLLSKMDRAVLAMYCTWWSKFCELERHLRGLGVTVEGRRAGESVKPPAWSMWKDASDRVHQLAKELGITPMVRLRTDLPSPAGDTDDDDDDILD
jgi:P27 family predicted phage terminase small subunit